MLYKLKAFWWKVRFAYARCTYYGDSVVTFQMGYDRAGEVIDDYGIAMDPHIAFIQDDDEYSKYE